MSIEIYYWSGYFSNRARLQYQNAESCCEKQNGTTHGEPDQYTVLEFLKIPWSRRDHMPKRSGKDQTIWGGNRRLIFFFDSLSAQQKPSKWIGKFIASKPQQKKKSSHPAFSFLVSQRLSHSLIDLAVCPLHGLNFACQKSDAFSKSTILLRMRNENDHFVYSSCAFFRDLPNSQDVSISLPFFH